MKEAKEINIYLEKNSIKHFKTIKCLGIVNDKKFKFDQHISYTADKCAKLFFSLSKSDKTH